MYENFKGSLFIHNSYKILEGLIPVIQKQSAGFRVLSPLTPLDPKGHSGS